MEWERLTEVAGAKLLANSFISADPPNFGLILSTYFLEHQKEEKTTNKSNVFFYFNKVDAHFSFIFCVYLFWLIMKSSLYQVLLCVSLITTLCILVFVNLVAFQLLDNNIKWIRRESRLLRAHLDDAQAITSLSHQIKTKAHQLWGSSGLDSAAAAAADAADNDISFWVKMTKSIVDYADELVKAFECQRKQELTFKSMSLSLSSVIQNLSNIDKLSRTEQIKDDINSSVKKAFELCSCESLEKSWSVIRTLVDKPIEAHDNKLVNSIVQVGACGLIYSVLEKVEATISMIDRKSLDNIDGLTVELQLMLLCPFLQNIKGVRLESWVERAWLKELDEVVSEAKAAVDTFSRVSSCQQRKWFRAPNILSVWKARRKFKEDMEYIAVSFSDLFEMKEKYGFKFIIRDSSESKHPYYQTTISEEHFPTLISNILNIKKQSPPLHCVSDELEWICDRLQQMLKLLQDTNSIAAIQNIRQAWLEQMKNIVTEVGSSINSPLRNTGARHQLSREIDHIKHRMCVLERSITAYNGELREESSRVVGLEEDVEAVVSRLTANATENQDCNFSIVGMEGIGKTTLAKTIYSHRAVVAHFPIRVWLSVPQNWDNNMFSFLKDIKVGALGSPDLHFKGEDNDFEHFKLWIRDSLKENKYLFIIDNVSTKEAFDSVIEEMSLPKTQGRRFLLTSRNENVASEAHRHRLRLRTSDESLRLLRQMVYVSSSEEKLAQKIVRSCSGLPLSIVRVGYMMLMEGITASDVPGKLPKRSPISMENDRLEKLVEHFELFVEDFEMPARRLIALWVSEGLVEQSGDDNETVEQVAEKRLDELVDLGIVQIVKRKRSGRVQTCRLPCTKRPLKDWAKETLLFERLAHHFDEYGHRDCRVHISRNDTQVDCSSTKLRSFITFNDGHGDEPSNNTGFFHPGSSDERQDDGPFQLDYRKLRSFHSFDPREGDEPGETIGNFLRKGIQRGHFQRFQVLDLEFVFKPELPINIGKLKMLKYLGLRWTCLQRLPPCVGDLVHLETLDVKHTYVCSLPSSVWKLQRLRNLYLHRSNHCRFMHHPRGNFLKKLQTLWGVFVDEDSPLKDCIHKSNDLRKLAMVIQLGEPEQKILSRKMSKLERLHTLRLRSIDENGESNMLFLNNLSSFTNLDSIELFGRLENPRLLIDTLPRKLTELTLSASGLSGLREKSIMRNLEELTNLKQLYFYSDSFMEKDMVFSSGSFPQLMVLKLWKINELEELIIKKDALQKLLHLEIRGCERMKRLQGLENLKTLAELKLTDMKEEFASTIVRDKMKTWGSITQSPLITITTGTDVDRDSSMLAHFQTLKELPSKEALRLSDPCFYFEKQLPLVTHVFCMEAEKLTVISV